MTLRRRAGLLAVVAGVVLAVVGSTRLAAPTAADFGAGPASTSPVVAVAGAAAPSPAASGTGPGVVVGTPGAVHSGTPAPAPDTSDGTDPPPGTSGTAIVTASPTAPAPPPSAPAADRPVEIRLDRLAVTAPIDEVYSVDGTLQVPDDPRRVGWWVASAWIGASAGTTVLDGHVDAADAGVGFFVHLRDLVEGDLITVTTASGPTVSYVVTARQTFPKSAPLPAALFDRDGPPTLVLVTCGGPFDRDRGSYEDNIAVTARPV